MAEPKVQPKPEKIMGGLSQNQSGFKTKESTEEKKVVAVELEPLAEVTISGNLERIVVYTETIRAEASFLGPGKRSLTVKQNREITVTAESE